MCLLNIFKVNVYVYNLARSIHFSNPWLKRKIAENQEQLFYIVNSSSRALRACATDEEERGNAINS